MQLALVDLLGTPLFCCATSLNSFRIDPGWAINTEAISLGEYLQAESLVAHRLVVAPSEVEIRRIGGGQRLFSYPSVLFCPGSRLVFFPGKLRLQRFLAGIDPGIAR